ncbi:MAG TPA: PQQ-binding-like beta-propeller repeat protein, partial [Herpetosiphonaceae bacterium]
GGWARLGRSAWRWSFPAALAVLVLVLWGAGRPSGQIDQSAGGAAQYLLVSSRPGIGVVDPGGRMQLVNLATGAAEWTLPGDDMVVSGDGSRAYALEVDATDGSELVAYEPAAGRELWRTPVAGHLIYPMGRLSVLALSPDGSRLYVHSYDSWRSTTDATWFQVFDTASGQRLPGTIPFGSRTNCPAPRFQTPPQGAKTYALCQSEIWVLDTEAGTSERRAAPGGLGGALVSPDGGSTYWVGYERGWAGPTVMKQLDGQPDSQRIRLSEPPSRPPDAWSLGGPGFLQEHPGRMALSADGTRLALAFTNQTSAGTDVSTDVRIYALPGGEQVGEISLRPPIDDGGIALSGDGKALYVIEGRLQQRTAVLGLDALTGAALARYEQPGRVRWIVLR